MPTITNPILPGFNPDPNILRVGDDFYIATSTFEWCPGVQIHHSKDLRHWKLLTHPLTRDAQLNMVGNPDSAGIWAPQLSYADGTFWLIYTGLKSHTGVFKDTHNYLVTAPSITGPWSDPIYLNSSGFDPSLFHDPDTGKKWLVNQLWDHRKGRNRFAGIVLQQYDHAQRKLVGPVKNIFKGTDLKVTEGPHLYKFHNMYYLLCAEGGTGWHHAVTIARSPTLEGPYEVDPNNPMLTARHDESLDLQKAGHASVVETPNGQWYMVHLCGRPLKGIKERRCSLGRETAIQQVEWTPDKWLRLTAGGNTPRIAVPAPNLSEHPWPAEPARDDFTSPALSPHYATLRVHADDSWCSLKARPGYLRLIGRESISSRHRQSLIARRLQSFHATATTAVDFTPASFKHMAGLAAFYDVENFYYLHITADDEGNRILNLLSANQNKHNEPLAEPIPLPPNGPIHLRVHFNGPAIQFAWSHDGQTFHHAGPALDASLLSDETTGRHAFTGTMIALACQDLDGTARHADFDFFEYQEA